MVEEIIMIRAFDPFPYDLEALEKQLDARSLYVDPASANYEADKSRMDWIEARILIGIQAKMISDMNTALEIMGEELAEHRKLIASLNHTIVLMGDFERIKKELHDLRSKGQDE